MRDEFMVSDSAIEAPRGELEEAATEQLRESGAKAPTEAAAEQLLESAEADKIGATHEHVVRAVLEEQKTPIGAKRASASRSRKTTSRNSGTS